MTEVSCQPQWLESICCVRVDQLRVARQEPQDVVDLAGSRRLKDRQRDRFICQERGDLRLSMIGRDQDGAETLLPNMDQTRVHDELAFHLMSVPLFDRIKKAETHMP